MSDPVTNSEVENVLASIRRLVGDTKKVEEASEEESATDRLILTQQQRVTEPDVLQLTPEDAVGSEENWQEYEEPPFETSDDLLVQESQGSAGESGAASEDASAEDNPAEEDELSSSNTEKADEESEEIDDDQQDNSNASELTENAQTLSEKIAALETAIARTHDEWDPDGNEQDAYAGSQSSAMTWQDDVELDGMGSPVDNNSEASDDDTSTDDTQIIDEETLHAMVTEIVQQLLSEKVVADAVRKELQGDLGIRISQNVRKLVRREIQLALSAQGLD